MAANSIKIFINLATVLFLLSTTRIPKTFSRSLLEEEMIRRHEDWMTLHGRVYKDTAEKERRYNIFKENVERIETFNNNGKDLGYKLGVNAFTDLTNEEFRAKYTGYNHKHTKPSNVMTSLETKPFKYDNFAAIPVSMDWRSKKAVTPIKDQGECGCCWAFSAVAAIEGITMIKKGKLTSLSEQQLVDCDTDYNMGCEGGFMEYAFQYIKKAGGLTTEANYPYEGIDGTCNSKKAANKAASITGYEDVPANNEKALLQAAANQPVSVAIEGSGFSFQFYSSGVFTGSCGTDLDHAVIVIGYGTSGGKKYWLVKNSWGTRWGENGYMKIQRDVSSKAGLCGIAMKASYPTA